MFQEVFVIRVHGIDGASNLKRLTALYGAIPRTLKVRTPYGDDYYFLPGDELVLTSVGKIAAGIDLHGDFGYVAGPGSRTPAGLYEFAQGFGPRDVAIAPAPAWLLALVEADYPYEEDEC